MLHYCHASANMYQDNGSSFEFCMPCLYIYPTPATCRAWLP